MPPVASVATGGLERLWPSPAEVDSNNRFLNWLPLRSSGRYKGRQSGLMVSESEPCESLAVVHSDR